MIDNVTIKAPKKVPGVPLTWGMIKAGQVVETTEGSLVLAVAGQDRSVRLVLIAKKAVQFDEDVDEDTSTTPVVIMNPAFGLLKRVLPAGTRITLTIEAE